MTLWSETEDSDPRKERRYSEKKDANRNKYQQDRDRLLYSAGFRRLGGITQIAAASELLLLHNRLTHSLKVAQVGRRIAEKLLRQHPEYADRLDPDVVETAGLAHDIGHPPFGHIAETELNSQLQELRVGGFEGNAQTFRYVAKTAVRRLESNEPGRGALDLTRASLNAMLKYPRCECDDDLSAPAGYEWSNRMLAPPGKWNAYDIDSEIFEWVRAGSQPGERSLEAAIMDWADDISYAVHDFEDYVRAGLIPAHALSADAPRLMEFVTEDLEQYLPFGFDMSSIEAAVQFLLGYETDYPYGGSRGDEHYLNQWVSDMITDCLDKTQLIDGRLVIDDEQQYLIEILKRVPAYYVIESPPFAMAQQGQRRMIGDLFKRLLDMMKARERSLPKSLQELVKSISLEPKARAERSHNADYVNARAASDYLCTITESQAVDLFARLEGSAPSMFHGPWM